MRNREIHILHEKVADLMTNAARGCHLCTLIRHYLKDGTSTTPSRAEDSEIPVWLFLKTAFGDWGTTYKMNVYVGSLQQVQSAPWNQEEWPFQVFRGSQSAGPSANFATKICPALSMAYLSTASQAHLSVARGWLDSCEALHPGCRPPKTDFIPTRLIYVGSLEAPSLCLKVTEQASQGDDDRHRYCALSHCWGGRNDILTLTSTNLDVLRNGFEMDALPKTFRDAVIITRSLGVSYLWIDTLCIMQDSGRDWAAEAEKMGRVYEEATCTIAAAAASNPHDGCFTSRRPLEIADCQIAGSKLGGDGIYVRPIWKRQVVSRCRLDTRAWTYQEAKLSHRQLRFGKLGIEWRCGLGAANEHNVFGEGKGYFGRDREFKAGPLFGEASRRNAIWSHSSLQKYQFLDQFRDDWGDGLEMAADLDGSIHRRWFQTIREYSKRELTFNTDKLTALSGVAGRIENVTGMKYMAGLWRQNLRDDLLWRVVGPLSAKPPEYRAPSWSWASVDGTIASALCTLTELDFCTGVWYAKRKERIDFLLTVADPSGNITTNELIEAPELNNSPERNSQALLQVACRLKALHSTAVMGYRADAYNGSLRCFTDSQILRFFPDTTEIVVSECFLLPVRRIVGEMQEDIFKCPFSLTIEGLVLVKVDAASPTTYRRVGMFGIYCDVMDQDVADWFEDCPVEITIE